MADVCEELSIQLVQRSLIEVLKQEVRDDVGQKGENTDSDLNNNISV